MQKALGNNQYPKSIIDANKISSNHKIEMLIKQQYTKTARKYNVLNDAEDVTSEDIPLSFTQIEGRCYCCDQYGHKPPQCRKRDQIAIEDWYINKINCDKNKINKELMLTIIC